MASIPLVKSESEIQNLSDNSLIIFDVNIPSDEDFAEDTEIEADEMSEFDDCKSTNSENRSASGESANVTLLSPDVYSYVSESEASPLPYRKKRPAPLPPNMSPSVATRHSYAFDQNAMRMRTSTDTESNTSESRLFYQTSTDSESLAMPESARGSNFPGELAGVDNLYAMTTRRPLNEDISQSPRGLSRLGRLREVFRSPQIGRRKTMREEKGGREKTPRMRKTKTGDGNTQLMKKSKVDEGSKSPKEKPTRLFDPVPQLSDWIMAAGYDELDIDQEFEVKRVLDYEKFLSELLEDTDNYHVDYVDISRSLIRVRSMMKERDEEIGNEDDTVMETAELRSSQDDLSTDNSTFGSKNSINSHDTSIGTHDNSFSTYDNSVSTHDNSSSAHDNSSTHDNSSSTHDNSSSTHDNSFSIVYNNNNNEDSDKLSARKLSSRRRSAPSALLFKSLASMKARSPTSVWYNAGLSKKDQDVIAQFKLADGDTDRVYVTEGSVQFAAGMQVQDRYLFLFTDLLLVTKQKSNTTFKLKQKVHLCDMWIASCIEDVSELTRPIDRSFVIGWPTTNVVATFPNVETKDDWLSKFSQNITKQKIKEEHKSLQLKVIPKDIEAVTCSSCQMAVDVFTQAKEVVLECLKQANLSDSDAKDYQLWVVAGKENSPYPLIGHETPYSIKYNLARELSRSRSANDLDNMTAVDLDTIVENISVSGSKCEFYLKQKQTPRNGQFEDSPHHKPMKKHKKTQNIFNTIFRKKRVFGLPLAKICDKNLDPPEGIIKLMVQVYQHGPQTSGILRRGNNTLLGKEIKEKINAGDKYHLEDTMTPTAASVFKEFLRCIPEGVLVCGLHEQWLCVRKDDPHEEKINKIKTLLAKLPAENFHLLKLTICLLQHLAKHCSVNHMGPSNLATCIAPSLFVQRTNRSSHGKWKGGDVQKQMQESVSEIQEVIVPLISFIITNHIELFGEDILSMFVRYGCQASPPGGLDDRYDGQIQPSADEEEEEEDMSGDEDDDNFSAELTDQHHRVQVHPGKPALMRDSNSGTDSDSMHSVLSMQDGGMGLHHDDSSIDSLGDRDYYSHESPKATKSHLSPSNLSRDSGLTLSDNQLYDEEAYQADIASASAKMFQAKMSSPDPPDLDSSDPGKSRQATSSQTDKHDSPIPPPRRRSMRIKACNVSSDGERHGFVEYSSPRPPLKHSTSTTYLDESPSSAAHKEQRRMGPLLSSADQRVSDSTGKVQEATDQPMDVQTMSARTNIGTLIKSASGSHLYLNTDTRPTEFSLQPIEGAAEPPVMRHPSVNGHSVPVSPESRHSHSSGDSVISSSIYSTSRDSSINSAPLTPEESPDISLSWIPDINLPGKPWDILLHGAGTAQPLAQTKSSDQSFRNETTSENSGVDTSETLNSPMSLRKSFVAEEVHISRKPHFSLMSDSSTNSSQPFSKNAPSLSSIQIGKQRFSAYLDLGSPPPDVILQTLQTSALRNLVPTSGEGAPHRRSSVDLAEPRHFHFSKEMQSIRPEEYLHVRSTPVIISPEGESGVATGATSKAKLSKYIKDKDFVLPLSKQHVDKPLNYEQVQRNFMMKYNEPDDITEKQREISARAKAMYEKSLQLFQKEEIQPPDNQASKTQSAENVAVSSNLAYVNKSKPGSETEDAQTGRLGHLDSTVTDYTSQDSFLSAVMSDDLDDSGASGFLDFGSVSLSLERDLGGHKHRTESDASSFNRSISPGNLLSIYRNESRLSDTDSSSSSTVTVSTLSQLSDSFNSHSDLSNTSSVTISSVTSSDSNPEIRSRSSNRRSARNLDPELSPVCPRNRSSEGINIEMLEDEDEVDNYTDDLKKDPKEIYLQSMQMYEQKGSHEVTSLIPKGVSSSSSQDVSSVSHGVKPSASSSGVPVIRKSLTSHPFVNAPKLQSSPASPAPSSQKTAPMAAASAGRPADSKTRASLDAPRVNLQRSCSDLSKHAHKQGSYSSHSTTAGQDGSADVKKNRQSALSASSVHSSKETQPRDVKSEYQQNFMRAKSCFHQAEGINKRHSDIVPYHPVQSLQQSPPAAKLGKQHMPHPSVTAEPNKSAANLSAVNRSTVKPSGASMSAATPSAANLSSAITSAASPPALSPEATVQHNQVTDSKSQVNKKEFPWSVKVLKSKYDTDKSRDIDSSRNTNESTSQTLTHSHPQSPLPLRNPSSLRQQGSPQRSRSNSSSSEQVSSCNTSPKTSVSYRHGPQSFPCEASHYSYSSSSDDSCSSSPEKRTTWLSGSSFDSEELSDYTNTTYI